MNGYHAVNDKDLILFNSSIDLSKIRFKKSREEIKHIHINVEGSEDRLATVDWCGVAKLDEIVFYANKASDTHKVTISKDELDLLNEYLDEILFELKEVKQLSKKVGILEQKKNKLYSIAEEINKC